MTSLADFTATALLLNQQQTGKLLAANAALEAEIVERKQSEEKYRTLFELIDEGFCICEMLFDENGEPHDYRFLEVNSIFGRLTGLEQATGKTARELIPNLEAFWFEIYGGVVQTGKPARFEQQSIVMNRWFDVNAFCIGEPQSNQFGVLFTNITARKQAEEALRQSEARLRAVAANLPHGAVFIVDHELRYLLAEGKALEDAGITSESLVGKTLWESLDPALATRYEPYYRQALSGELFSLEHCSHNRYYVSHGTPLYNDRGEVNAVLAVSYDITERKQTEEALRESEELKQRILESSNDCIKVLNLDGEILYINTGGLRLLEIEDVTNILNTNWVDFWQGEDHECVKTAIAAAKAGNMSQFRGNCSTRKGTPKWWDSVVTPIRDASGQVVQLVAISRDITQQKQAEDVLRDSEEQFRNMADHAPFMVWVTNPSGYCTYLSQSWYDFTGQNPESGLGFGWLNRTHPDDREAAERMFLDANEQQEAFRLEYRLQRKDGEYIWVIDAASPWFGVDGQFKGYIGSVIDISERKQAELEREYLLARERHYVNQLQGLTTAALAINSALSVEQVLQVITDQAASIIGAHQSVTSMTIDQNWAQAINAVYLSQKYAQWRDYDEQPDKSGIYACVCHMNRPLRMTQAELEAHPRWKGGYGNAADKHPQMRGWLAAPLIGRDGHNIGLIQLSDKYEGEFTEADESILVQLGQMASVAVENARLYEAEQQARSTAEAAREEAQAANRIKDEFLAVLSHELRSPLNPILGWTKLLQNGKLNPNRQAEALKTIERNAKLQSQLIEDLLDISRIMQGKLSLTAAPVSLTFVISAAVETVRLAAEAKNIQILLDLTTTIAPVSGDAARLQQVLWNLLTNAVKFTPNGGQVTVELRQLDQLAQIRVLDTGKGIQPQFLPHVFEYFRQEDGSTTRKFGGLGLGLAIVRQIVEIHGGTVKAESLGENQGAIFTVQLPVTRQAVLSVSELTRTSMGTELPLSNLQILIVDDDNDTREFQAFLLEQSGAKVIAVASGLEALQVLDQFIPDVLVSDVGMAEMDGYMLIQQIRSRPPNQGGTIPAVAVTAYAGNFDKQKALQAGFQAHITKPVELEELVGAIVNLLKHN